MREETKVKQWGIGSLSLLISLGSMVIAYGSINSDTSMGGSFFGASMIYGVICFALWCLAIYLGDKYIDHYCAKAGLAIGEYSIIVVMIVMVITVAIDIF